MNDFMREIPHYVFIDETGQARRVQALKIRHIIPNPRGYELHFYDDSIVPMQVSTELVDGFYIEEDDYCVWDEGTMRVVTDYAFRNSYCSEADFVKRQYTYLGTLKVVASCMFGSWGALGSFYRDVRECFLPFLGAALNLLLALFGPLLFVLYPLFAWTYVRDLRKYELARLEQQRRWLSR